MENRPRWSAWAVPLLIAFAAATPASAQVLGGTPTAPLTTYYAGAHEFRRTVCVPAASVRGTPHVRFTVKSFWSGTCEFYDVPTYPIAPQSVTKTFCEDLGLGFQVSGALPSASVSGGVSGSWGSCVVVTQGSIPIDLVCAEYAGFGRELNFEAIDVAPDGTIWGRSGWTPLAPMDNGCERSRFLPP